MPSISLLVLDELLRNLQGPVENGREGCKKLLALPKVLYFHKHFYWRELAVP